MLSSEDLLVILALQQEQTLERAGLSLGKDVSSVFRAIKRIEQRLGAPLFERSKAGYHPLPIAEDLAEQAREVSKALSVANGLVTNQSTSKRLRVTTTDVLLEYCILPKIHLFRDRFPEIEMEFGTSNQFAKLWERGFDIAVRPSTSPPEQLIGHFLSPLGYQIAFAEGTDPAIVSEGEKLKGGNWLVPGGALNQHATRKWFNRHVVDPISITSFDSMSLLAKATQAGQGVSVLPKLAPLLQGMCSIDSYCVDEYSELWCLYHPSNKQNPLIRHFMRFLRMILPD